MIDTPETDALRERFLTAGEWPDLFAHARRLERERDEAREKAQQWERISIRLDNERTKLRDIAELLLVGELKSDDFRKIRAELDQLKEDAK